MGSIVVGLIIAGAAALAIRALWKDHKSGKSCSGCSGDCAHCKSHH